jgi:TRAP-type transport system periplasmic protein
MPFVAPGTGRVRGRCAAIFEQWRGETMNKALKGLSVAAAACGLLLAAGVANAEIRPHNFRMASAHPDDDAIGVGMVKFAEEVSKKSGGKMTVKLFGNSVLGKDLATVTMMQGGVLDFSVMNTNLLVGMAKECGLVDLPFLFANAKQAFAVLDGPVGKKIHASLEPKGITGVGYFAIGFYHFHSNKKPFNKVEDFEGQKLRVSETPISIDFVKAMGGNAVPMAYMEIYNAFEQKVVDGASQPLLNLQFAKFFEVQKYLSLTYNTYTMQSVLMSKKVWDGLNADERKVIEEAMAVAAPVQREASDKSDDESLKFLKTKMTVNDVAPAEIERMKAKVKPMIDKYAKEYNEDLAKELFAAIEKAPK